ncbi:MAG: TIM barrel protein [Acidobacteria bacterium]|nr:TIM barrel protein [Acidobacteriota bacterium]
MPSPVSRRAFLGAAALAAAARPEAPMNKLGLDAFSLRSQGWTPFQLLDFAAEHGAQIVHFSEPRFLGSSEPAHLGKVREHADRLDLGVEVGFGSICPTSTRFDQAAGTPRKQLLAMLEAAKALRSPIVRCYLGSSNDRQGKTPFAQHIENTIASCRSVRSEFVDAGVKIAVENHAGDMQALELKGLIEAAGKEYVGALLDAGNATWTLEDPHHTLEILAPLAVTTGVRDSRIWESERGAEVMWVPFGEGNIDIERWRKRLGELRPDLTFELEIINLRSPRSFRYKDPEFWDDYRDVPAWVFRKFETLAEQGRPYQAPQPPMTKESDPKGLEEWTARQEREDVAHDLAFCRQTLGLGRA